MTLLSKQMKPLFNYITKAMSNINMNADKTMLRVGATLERGKYRIDRYLSSGGFGNTYLATNISFDEKVAIKEFFMKDINMRAGESTSVSLGNVTQMPIFQEQMEKFKTEAKRLRKLKHKNIVEVTDLFDENGTTYYVMDFIDGQSLRDMVQQRGKLVEQEVRGYLEQTLDALEMVHRGGFYHLDIKPANIMVDKTGRVRLIDFGASKQQTPDGGATSRSAICYTPGYAPIEQKDQERGNFGPWTDLYALGATLYNVLSGETPPSTSKIADYGEEAFKFPATVSEDMKKLIIWMMKGRRLDRPQSVAEVKAFLKGEKPPVSKPPINDTNDDEEDDVDTILPGSEEHKRLIVKTIVNNMVAVEGGTYIFDTNPHPGNVYTAGEELLYAVSPFKISKYTVTQEEWKCLMGNNPSESKGMQKPVTNVSWFDCQNFIKVLNQLTDDKYRFRLPYEAEWEFAAMGGKKDIGMYQYAGGNNLETIAWTNEPDGAIHPVGQKEPNALGLYDMTGNVWEWCQDEYTEPGKGEHVDKSKERAYRGAAFDTPDFDCPLNLRRSGVPTKQTNGIGFRLACSVNGERVTPPKEVKREKPPVNEPVGGKSNKKETGKDKPVPPVKEPLKVNPPKTSNRKLIYGACAAVILIVIFLALPKGSETPDDSSLEKVEALKTLVPENVTDKSFKNDVLGEYLYTGPVDEEGLPNGTGEAKFTIKGNLTGKTYKGPFENGNMTGDSEAVVKMENGDTFVGTFKNNLFEKGKYTVATSGEYFVGSFSKGQPSVGTWYNKNDRKIQDVK